MNATSCRAVSIGLFLRLLHLLLPPLWSSAAMKPSAWHIFFSILSCSVIVRLLSCLLFFKNYFTIFICLFLGRSFNDEPGRQGSFPQAIVLIVTPAAHPTSTVGFWLLISLLDQTPFTTERSFGCLHSGEKKSRGAPLSVPLGSPADFGHNSANSALDSQKN